MLIIRCGEYADLGVRDSKGIATSYEIVEIIIPWFPSSS